MPKIKPRYINKPFNRLSPKVRAVFILHLAGFSCREIEKLCVTSHMTISRWILRGYIEYPSENVTKKRIYMEAK